MAHCMSKNNIKTFYSPSKNHSLARQSPLAIHIIN
ncbi:hypothetical protein COLO4_03530 [Corchorus olitorius]|uniref:Uncharacterized protein n=1 Tax=Corchorus olitorius TaxID=93759 RepID=A0A1R3KYA5_9ROSI|nr:hypothetical protein COLO4_03530 [Corchorus olitorius]